ncbi:MULTISPECIES: ATPase, T2SS/T4P/T4SS family [unclassified Sporosarcina]|uniref:ATPase, T2SS/T4P/T4SS family n=1 Tax=unclassified Sporosarcina TaxID=2647733 RepID=UPI001A92155A|nr:MULTISPECIES: ATPase, T2SS/T4P/T4SS family [unclassified Sporosarcina]MBO0589266.1 Flp pilus assembly complex ATPase component TadA [Sporosarcina sp. E16_8]MBO0601973.1 Flp pilus assembly complex ATPase component TadA [Sporosarcina sp. E16_3]
MTFWFNASIILMLICIVFFVVAWRVLQGSKQKGPSELSDREHYSIPKIEKHVKEKLTELTTMNLYNLGLSEEEFNRQNRRRQELKEALKNCNTGDFGSKTYVREFMYDFLQKSYGFNEENINWAIPFNTPSQLSGRDVFDILLFLYTKEHGKNGLGQLLEEYGLANPKDDGGYRIQEREIREIYNEKVKYLRYEDKVRIVVQRIYAQFKGFGVIDDIRDASIDGVSGGVSGLPPRMENFDNEEQMISSFSTGKTGLNSVWIMYKGKSIHLSFLQFEHEAELRRVVQNSYKYNFPGQLSESKPYIINEMHDGSRVTVVRPKFSESWAFFIRKKYDMQNLDLEQLITHPNAELPITLMKYMIKGNRVTAITGGQGSGKTTLLMALIEHIHKALNLRIQETSFELNLRSLYPDRNILSFQETDNISGQDGLDLQKKTDGAVNILGEVATDPVAAWMIQTAQVASLFTIFTHHAKTFSILVDSIRNSLLKTNTFSNEAIAEEQVVSVLEFDIHLRQDYDGSRYIERITECVPVQTIQDDTDILSKDIGQEEKMDAFLLAATRFFNRQTQKHYKARNVIEFVDGKYVAGEPLSHERQKDIESNLSLDEQKAFRTFVKEVWGDVA